MLQSACFSTLKTLSRLTPASWSVWHLTLPRLVRLLRQLVAVVVGAIKMQPFKGEQ